MSARHGHLSDTTRQRILEKVEKLPRYFERLTSIGLTVDLTDETAPAVELLVSAEHKHDFVAAERSESLLTSVETVVQRMEQQLRKYKDRLQDHRRPGAGFVAPQKAPGAASADEEPD
ncbi:MAG: ribosome-associated translation inhibitor RaiA [Planctomycetia bacterium]|nr:ribosome-associated translation inhibitor RaiA [Planctomycetia bacterium]